MNVVIVDAMVPFASPGPAEERAETLLARVRAAGHRADPIRLPFRWDGDQLAQTQGVRLLGLAWIDVVVALRFPAVAVDHPRKVVWLDDGPLAGTADPATRAAERALLDGAERIVTASGEAGIAEILGALA